MTVHRSLDDASTADPDLAIDVTDLTVTYADGTCAVDDLDLTVETGQCVGLLGANGAGKTTTVEVLATLSGHTAGDVRVLDTDVSTDPTSVRARIGYMPQSVTIDTDLTARENLRFAAAAHGVDRSDGDERIDAILDVVGLADVADTPAGRFSGGMQKRLDAATALVHDPEVVFLDEPTTGLDPTARERLWSYVEDCIAGGTTVVLTTQYLAEADRLCDQIVVLDSGAAIARGTPDALKRRVGGTVLDVQLADSGSVDAAATTIKALDALDGAEVDTDAPSVRVRDPAAGDAAPAVLDALSAAGHDVTGFDLGRPSLEDVFHAVAAGDAGAQGGRSA